MWVSIDEDGTIEGIIQEARWFSNAKLRFPSQRRFRPFLPRVRSGRACSCAFDDCAA